MVSLGKASLGISTFFASQHPTDQCGSNGLPLTPNSIVIFGRFQKLKTLLHRNICQYLDIVRSKHERLIVVQEHYEKNFSTLSKQDQNPCFKTLKKIVYEVLDALAYLNEHGIVHRNLAPDNILTDAEGNVKLAKFGLYYMTGGGHDVSFPIGCPRYMAPEVVAAGLDLFPVFGQSGAKADVWSLGMIILEHLLGTPLWPDVTEHKDTQEIFDRIFLLARKCKDSSEHPLDLLLKEHNAEGKFQDVPSDFMKFLRTCLMVQISDRLSPKQLMSNSFFTDIGKPKTCKLRNMFYEFPKTIDCLELELPRYEDIYEEVMNGKDYLAERPIHEVYYMWTLAGGDVEAELKKQGLIKTCPPILSIPNVILESGEILGLERDRIMLLDETTVSLSLQQLRKVLGHLKPSAFYPLIEEKDPNPYIVSYETTNLPLVIREKDVEYQFHRIVLFQRLLEGYPYTKDRIHKEAKIDIPPSVRPLVWASLLGVQGDVQGRYEEIDKESATSTDRQIEVDIPRCHQYDPLLSSPAAHKKLKRVLKAWIVSHPHLSYWQGLDSLCAAFLSLNFNNEALAYACLSAFIPKYLYNFFMKDNSPVIQEYLAVFSQLIAFHDPELFNHLDGIGFMPELYSIPWFLTMFAHVFPLHKIYHLWDTLLLGNSSLPLCFGVAILKQLRDQLLSFGFNECILLFSDMPEIDIQQCVLESIKTFCVTPRTSTLRQNDSFSNILVNGQTKPEKEFISIAQLKLEISPRISAQDLIHICDLSQSAKGNGKLVERSNPNKRKKPKGLVIDIRTPEEFSRGCVSGSVNTPYSQAFSEDGQLAPCPAVDTITSLRGRILIVVGNKGEHSHKFAASLVKLNYPKVCVLECPVTNLRAFQGVIIIPNS